MARVVTDAGEHLRDRLGSEGKVLLINPPVQEKRYHWLRWNQPLELLRLSTWLKTRTGSREVMLYDFMFPDERGDVPRHKVKETWTGVGSDALWHFGQPFEEFEEFFDGLMKRAWIPDLIIISSLTSYWHLSIEKLLVKICNLLGPERRVRATIALYGAYPSIEPEHAGNQRNADIAFTTPIDGSGCVPDFRLYFEQVKRAPLFFSLDIDDPDVADYIRFCLKLQDGWNRRRGIAKSMPITVAFFNDDICGPKSQLEELTRQAGDYKGRVRIDAICGLQPRSISVDRLEMLAAIGTKSLFIEYATKPDGELDERAYEPFREFLARDRDRRRAGGEAELQARDAVTAFVNIGLPGDNLEAIVRSTLRLNQLFQAIILKPFGYSPNLDPASAVERSARWTTPAKSSPQWFPYVGCGSSLDLADYDNLMRWQGIMNKRVKNFTFDFLGDGAVPQLVRETLIEESWKRHREGQA